MDPNLALTSIYSQWKAENPDADDEDFNRIGWDTFAEYSEEATVFDAKDCDAIIETFAQYKQVLESPHLLTEGLAGGIVVGTVSSMLLVIRRFTNLYLDTRIGKFGNSDSLKKENIWTGAHRSLLQKIVDSRINASNSGRSGFFSLWYWIPKDANYAGTIDIENGQRLQLIAKNILQLIKGYRGGSAATSENTSNFLANNPDINTPEIFEQKIINMMNTTVISGPFKPIGEYSINSAGEKKAGRSYFTKKIPNQNGGVFYQDTYKYFGGLFKNKKKFSEIVTAVAGILYQISHIEKGNMSMDGSVETASKISSFLNFGYWYQDVRQATAFSDWTQGGGGETGTVPTIIGDADGQVSRKTRSGRKTYDFPPSDIRWFGDSAKFNNFIPQSGEFQKYWLNNPDRDNEVQYSEQPDKPGSLNDLEAWYDYSFDKNVKQFSDDDRTNTGWALSKIGIESTSYEHRRNRSNSVIPVKLSRLKKQMPNPRLLVTSAWEHMLAELDRWAEVSGDPDQTLWEEFGDGINKPYTQRAIYDQYVSVTAFVLGVFYLSVNQSAEAFTFWQGLPQADKDLTIDEDGKVGYKDGTFDEADLTALGSLAEQSDSVAFDKAAAEAADKEENKLSDKEVKGRQIFLKQCALLLNLEELKTAYQVELKSSAGGKNAYGNRIHTIDVNDATNRDQIMNFIISPKLKQVKEFLKISPEIQAALVPKIRLFKVYNDESDSNILKEIEFSFPNYYDPNSKKFKLAGGETTEGAGFSDVHRGGGCGIKDLSFVFEGTNPATVEKDIKAEMTMYFQDFNELLKERSSDNLFNTSGKMEKFKYLELLLIPGSPAIAKTSTDDDGKKYKENLMSYDPSNYRIKIDVGWVPRNDDSFRSLLKDRGIDPDLFKLSMKHVNRSFYMAKIDHELDFNDDGSVTIKINYGGFTEEATRSNSMDALNTPELAKKKKIINDEHDQIIRDKTCEDNPKAYQELLQTYNALEIQYLKESHQSILKRLIKNKKLHYCFIDQDAVDSFAEFGFFKRSPRLIWPGEEASGIVSADAEVKVETVAEDPDAEEEDKTYKDTFSDTSLKNLKDIEVTPSSTQRLVTYFYMGDLINVALDSLENPATPGEIYPHMKNFKVVMSGFNYKDSLDRNNHINISEIPIATEYFFEWMNQEVIKIRRRAYPVHMFVKDLCNKLIIDLMMEACLNNTGDKKMDFKTMSITCLGKLDTTDGTDRWVDPLGDESGIPKIEGSHHMNVKQGHQSDLLPLSTDVPPGNIKGIFNYLVIYASTATKIKYGSGLRKEDGENGIFHFGLGETKGIVKKIKFTKHDIKGLREARFMNHGRDGLAQLSNAYKATIEMFGNFLFYPGMLLYIDPVGLGGDDFDPTKLGSVANALGFGGYHGLTRVKTSMGPGKFSTTVEGYWQHSGDGDSAGAFYDGDEDIKAGVDSVLTSRAVDDKCSMITMIRQVNLENQHEGANANFAGLAEQNLKEIIEDSSAIELYTNSQVETVKSAAALQVEQELAEAQEKARIATASSEDLEAEASELLAALGEDLTEEQMTRIEELNDAAFAAAEREAEEADKAERIAQYRAFRQSFEDKYAKLLWSVEQSLAYGSKTGYEFYYAKYLECIERQADDELSVEGCPKPHKSDPSSSQAYMDFLWTNHPDGKKAYEAL